MGSISLCSNHSADVTIISNQFIDSYMPAANGSYVKVYLYLLRCLSDTNFEITISSIADHLEDSEKDIMRALKYWEKVNLITLDKNNQHEISSITLNELENPKQELPTVPPQIISEIAVTEEPPQANSQIKSVIGKPTYTAAQIEELTKNDQIKWLLNIIEIYLERLLKPTDIQLILYLYESIGFSVDLILYLYEYCVSKNKKNPSYIEAVALSWAEEGINTVEKAEASATIYNSNYNSVIKAFGLNRSLGNVEKQFIDKWLKKYCFELNIIVEACNRTILATNKPDFKYTDKILENWHKKGVKLFTDIAKLDEVHTKSVAKTYDKQTVSSKAAPNRFNAFPQRNYTKEDYSSMEQRLLNK